MEDNFEDWKKGYDAFYAKYPDCPKVDNIEVLDLIMKREEANNIVNGTKTVEFREVSSHYESRLVDKKLFDYIDKKVDEEDWDFLDEYELYASPIKTVQSIHFHNYNNTWHLDVAVESNGLIELDEEGMELLHSWGNHEMDESYEKSDKEEPIALFYFKLGEIIEAVESI